MAILIMPETKGKYTNKNVISNTIRYITRTRVNEDRRFELLLYGSPNTLIFSESGVANAISEFDVVQRYYHGIYLKGSKVYHEILRMSDDETEFFMQNLRLLDMYAFDCARLYAGLGHQVVYAVHKSIDKGLHVHFIINAVKYTDGLKWHSSIKDQKDREAFFNQLIQGIMTTNMWQFGSSPVIVYPTALQNA